MMNVRLIGLIESHIKFVRITITTAQLIDEHNMLSGASHPCSDTLVKPEKQLNQSEGTNGVTIHLSGDAIHSNLSDQTAADVASALRK
jgi:hypothetical protein